MSEAEFFSQSIILWHDRLDGFSELHGGGSKGGEAAETFTKTDLDRLMEEYPDERPN